MMKKKYHKWALQELKELVHVVNIYNHKWKRIQEHYQSRFTISQLRNKHYQVLQHHREMLKRKEQQMQDQQMYQDNKSVESKDSFSSDQEIVINKTPENLYSREERAQMAHQLKMLLNY